MKKNIIIIFGGKSTEHDISILTGLQILSAIEKKDKKVVPVYISQSGKWYCGKSLEDVKFYSHFEEKKLDEVTVIPNSKFLYTNKRGKFIPSMIIDCAIIACHGKNGEDGTIQGLFELNGIPYSSSGVLGSCLGLNKIAMKKMFSALKMPICKYVEVSKKQYEKNGTKTILEQIEFPVIVKPNLLGSSIGISACKMQEELDEAIKLAFVFDEKIIVEKMVENLKEVNISVLGNGENCKCSVTEEPLTKGDILSFGKKYLNSHSQNGEYTSKNGMQNLDRVIPANITKKQEKDIELYAKKIFENFECKGVVRIDFMINSKTKKVYVNEINTIPGSFAFYLWEKSGVSFDELANQMIEIAVQNRYEQDKLTTTFPTSVLNLGTTKK